MDVLVAIDAVDDLLHNARVVPLSDEVRVDPEELGGLIQRMRSSLREQLADPEPSRSWAQVDRLQAELRAARKMPMSNHVRVDRERMYDILDWLRAVVLADLRADDPSADPVAVAADGVLSVLGRSRARLVAVDREDLGAAVARLRAVVETERHGFDRSRASHALDRLEAIVRDAKPRRVGRGVRIEREPFVALLRELSAG